MAKKYRKNSNSKLFAILRAKGTKVEKKEKTIICRGGQPLSDTDSLMWVYKYIKLKNLKIAVTEITSVSYITIIGNRIYTVVYYDSVHNGILHCHIANSINDPSDSPIPLSVRKRGNQKKLLTWAIRDIKNNFYIYRKKFYKRSNLRT